MRIAVRSVSAVLGPTAATACHSATKPVTLVWPWTSLDVRSALALSDPDPPNPPGGAALCLTAKWSVPTGLWEILPLDVKYASVSHHRPQRNQHHPGMVEVACATQSRAIWNVTSDGTGTLPLVVKSAAAPRIPTPWHVSIIFNHNQPLVGRETHTHKHTKRKKFLVQR